METYLTTLVVSNHNHFRNKWWEEYRSKGFSVNLERDLYGALKRIDDGIYDLVVIDLESIKLWNKGYEEWLELEKKWKNFKKPPIIQILER